MEHFGGLLKGLYIALPMLLLNNLKACFKRVEGALGWLTHVYAAAARPSGLGLALGGLQVVGCGPHCLFFGGIFFELFAYKQS